MPESEHTRLKRLDATFYRGRAYVHWTLTLNDRQTGWLNAMHHQALRAILFHTCARFYLTCPTYCLMPDHGHFLFVGLDQRADQLAALTWMRRSWNALLQPYILQNQAYDQVLRESDREREAFGAVASYILHNPVRKELVDTWQQWDYSGAILPGYPKLNPRSIHFWKNYWNAYLRQGGTEA
jgi:REP element-mobilizing transposase RayT